MIRNAFDPELRHHATAGVRAHGQAGDGAAEALDLSARGPKQAEIEV